MSLVQGYEGFVSSAPCLAQFFIYCNAGIFFIQLLCVKNRDMPLTTTFRTL